jgi:hypothetical protein
MTGTGERPAELADLQSAWRRDGRSLNGGAWDEISDVLWLQAGRYFCDLRTPLPGATPTHMLDQPQAFSGSVQVSGGYISFHHDLDSLARDPAHPDQGTVHRLGDAMYERGPGFEERWVVASLPGDRVAVAECREGPTADASIAARIVRVGPQAIAVWGGPMAGGAQFRARHGWETDRALRHDNDDPWRVEEAVGALGFDDPLPRGWKTIMMGQVPT